MASGQTLNQIVLITTLIIVFYFLFIRPQIKQQKKRRDVIESVRVGDKIVTIGGIFAKVKEIKDDELMIEVAKNVILKINKGAISKKITKKFK